MTAHWFSTTRGAVLPVFLTFLGVGCLRYSYTGSMPPHTQPDDRVAEALLWAAGGGLGFGGARALVRSGVAPLPATAAGAGAGGLAWSAGPDSALGRLAGGVAVGSAIAGTAAATMPNFRIGVRPRLFITHSYRHSAEYDALLGLLAAAGLDLFDHSVPEERQFDVRSRAELKELLRGQIKGVSALVLLATPGLERRPISKAEVGMAVEMEKPVLVVDPDPQRPCRLPPLLKDYDHMERVPLRAASGVVGVVSRLRASKSKSK